MPLKTPPLLFAFGRQAQTAAQNHEHLEKHMVLLQEKPVIGGELKAMFAHDRNDMIGGLLPSLSSFKDCIAWDIVSPRIVGRWVSYRILRCHGSV